MTKAVRVHQGRAVPRRLSMRTVDVPAPAPGEVRIKQHAVGLNFIDVYYRTGLYKAPAMPFVVGNEAAGEVVAVGPGVTDFHPGDRVAYYFNLGGYATERNIPADKLVKLPDHITYEQGAVLMLKGLTVWYLLHKTFKVEPRPSRTDPCRGRRDRASRLSVGEGAWRERHRHRRIEGQGRSRAGQWLRSRHPLQGGGFRRARQTDQPQRIVRRGL